MNTLEKAFYGTIDNDVTVISNENDKVVTGTSLPLIDNGEELNAILVNGNQFWLKDVDSIILKQNKTILVMK